MLSFTEINAFKQARLKLCIVSLNYVTESIDSIHEIWTRLRTRNSSDSTTK